MNEKIYLMHPLDDLATVSQIFTLYYLEYTPEYRSPVESHDFWELNYADKGSFYVGCDGEEYLIEEGSLIMLPPNCRHMLRADGKNPSNAFIVSFAAQSPALEVLGCTVLKATPEIRSLMKSIGSEAEQVFQLPMPLTDVNRLKDRDDAPLGGFQLVRMRIEELLIRILREATGVQQSGGAQIFTSKAKFDDAIATRVQAVLERGRFGPMKLEELTRELGYGKTYLSGIFRRVYGVSIMERHAQLRLQEAKYLLRVEGVTVAEVADRLGFSTPQYFSRFFSQQEGMPPSKYVQSVKGEWAAAVEEARK